jgi:Tfp pilus assembly PilM family ATPase
MKIRIDIDCTPQEARAFLGLPHVEPMQEALVAQMQERLARYLEAMEPDALMSAWLPGGSKGLAELQQQFWQQMTQMQDAGRKKKG